MPYFSPTMQWIRGLHVTWPRLGGNNDATSFSSEHLINRQLHEVPELPSSASLGDQSINQSKASRDKVLIHRRQETRTCRPTSNGANAETEWTGETASRKQRYRDYITTEPSDNDQPHTGARRVCNVHLACAHTEKIILCTPRRSDEIKLKTSRWRI